MVGHNPQFTYRKDGVFYFSRRIPKDIRDRYEADNFVMSLRTKSHEAAARSSPSGTVCGIASVPLNALPTSSVPSADGPLKESAINMEKGHSLTVMYGWIERLTTKVQEP